MCLYVWRAVCGDSLEVMNQDHWGCFTTVFKIKLSSKARMPPTELEPTEPAEPPSGRPQFWLAAMSWVDTWGELMDLQEVSCNCE